MPRFIRKPVIVEAHRWFKNGDHPEDEYNEYKPSEGKLVGYYTTSNVIMLRLCRVCKSYLRDHGVIVEQGERTKVCPGDWIITDVDGKHFPISDDLFRKTYKEY